MAWAVAETAVTGFKFVLARFVLTTGLDVWNFGARLVGVFVAATAFWTKLCDLLCSAAFALAWSVLTELTGRIAQLVALWGDLLAASGILARLVPYPQCAGFPLTLLVPTKLPLEAVSGAKAKLLAECLVVTGLLFKPEALAPSLRSRTDLENAPF